MEDINNNFSNYTTIHDFFQNNGVGDYRIQCNYGGVTYVTDGYIHAGNKFWSDNFIDSHFNREIKMDPQIPLLAKEYAGNKLPMSMLLDKDIIKITECQKKTKSVETENESGDLVRSKQKRIKCFTTKLSYDDVHIYNNDKTSTFSFEHSAANDPNYHLEVTFTKINDNKPGFWQKLGHMFS
ncbi:MAG: hypothetical protein PG981_000435 [Wolbachia endosymbiont of Ctenocephalides orientis wCori]|nr:MAG: hypothetical protein PG981_000435 [Wolbachia endosymbiont of Ctenocephalides orientis wCori]